MPKQLVPLGRGNVYRDRRTGEIVIDQDSIKRNFAGDDDLGGDDFGEDDLGEDDLGEDDLGEDDLGEDDVGDDELGRKRRRRRARGKKGRGGRPTMIKTVLSGKKVFTAAGTDTITITPQHLFLAEDITFDASLAGTLVNSIRFGDDTVWSADDGVPFTVFAATGFLRNIIKGAKISNGYSIKVSVTVTGAGTVYATLTGRKPKNSSC